MYPIKPDFSKFNGDFGGDFSGDFGDSDDFSKLSDPYYIASPSFAEYYAQGCLR